MLKYYVANQEYIKGRVLIIQEPKWDSDFLNIFRKEKCQHLRLSYSAGWRQTEVSFLNEFSNTELLGLDIFDIKVKDIKILDKFKKLRRLTINVPCNKAPDMRVFRDLEVLFFDHRKCMMPSYQATKPWALSVTRYPFENLLPIRSFSKLRYLQIHGGNLISLKGLENFPELEHIKLYNLRHLESIREIHDTPHINAIEVERCKNVDSMRVARYHKMNYIR